MKFIWIFLITLGSMFLVPSDANAQIFGRTHHHYYYPSYYYYQPYQPYQYYNYGYISPYYMPGPVFLDYRQLYQVPGFYYR